MRASGTFSRILRMLPSSFAQQTPLYGLRRLISTTVSPASMRDFASGKVCNSSDWKCAFDMFPDVTQITWGGEPFLSTRRTKSSSFVITTTPELLARLNISGSSASCRSRSRTWRHWIPNVASIHPASCGESWASSQIVTRRVWDGLRVGWRNEDKPGCLRVQDRDVPL